MGLGAEVVVRGLKVVGGTQSGVWGVRVGYGRLKKSFKKYFSYFLYENHFPPIENKIKKIYFKIIKSTKHNIFFRTTNTLKARNC